MAQKREKIKAKKKNAMMVINEGYYTDGFMACKADLFDYAEPEFQYISEHGGNIGYKRGSKLDDLPKIVAVITDAQTKELYPCEDTRFSYSIADASADTRIFYIPEIKKTVHINMDYFKLLNSIEGELLADKFRVVKKDKDGNIIMIVMAIANVRSDFNLLRKESELK